MDELRQIDANLLLTLHALLVERHVTRAALRLHKSQPAVSHALAHLRDVFQDPLLTRRGLGMMLTPRAEALLPPLEAALGQLNALLRPGGFEPATANHHFRVAMSDYAAHLILPSLMPRWRSHAPGVTLTVCQASRETMLAQLADGEIDLALGVFTAAPDSILCDTLFDEHFVSVADAAGVSSKGLALDAWLARPHVLVATQGADSEIDAVLSAVGRRRHVALTLPHWSAALRVLPGTDLVLTVASRTLAHAPRPAGLKQFAPPLATPRFAFQQAWHARRDADAGHAWLRQEMKACCR